MFWRILCFFCWITPAPLALKAQNFLFESLPSETGAIRGTITCILQDREGFLWMGSWAGLMRYDGYSINWYYQSSDKPTGLESSKITALFEDHSGNLWVGTRNAGLYCYDRAKDRFIPAQQWLDSSNPLSCGDITAITGDPYGGLWVGTENGLNYFDPQKKQFDIFFAEKGSKYSLSNNFIYSLARTPDGAIWAGTVMGLDRLAPDWKTADIPVRRYQLGPEQVPLSEREQWNFIYTLVPSQHRPNCIWAGTKTGLHLIQLDTHDPQGLQVTSYRTQNGQLSHNYVRAIAETDSPSAGSVWVGTFDGLTYINLETGVSQKLHHHPEKKFSLSNSNVHTICTDHSGILWVGTEKGVNKLNFTSGIFELHPLPPVKNFGNSIVYTLSMGNYGNRIWAGTPGAGLFSIPLLSDGVTDWEHITHYHLHPPHAGQLGNFISAIAADQQGALWVATQGAGVLKIEENQLKSSTAPAPVAEQFFKGTSPRSIADDYVMSIFPQSAYGVWMGLWDAGMSYYDRVEDRVYAFAQSSDGNVDFRLKPIIVINETTTSSGEHFLWVGTRGNGLYQLKFDRDRHYLSLVRHYFHQPGSISVSSNFITSIFTDSKGKLWVTTENGLNYFSPAANNFVHVNTAGLASPIIQAALEDRFGRMWISTQNGISSFMAEDATIKTTSYDHRDGLKDQVFNSDAKLQTPQGIFLFGGVNGITSFRPETVATDPSSPLVAITGLRLFNRPIQVGVPAENGFVLEKSLSQIERLTLSARENMVSFEFSALHFAHPEKNLFAYKLEGFNKEWIYTDARERVANYTNLPHGNYTFLVMAANSDGVWNPNPARLNITILPPWWLTWWAYMAYLLLFAGILYGVRRVTLIRANLRNQLQIERLEKQKLEEVNQMKLLFFTNISHELKTPLTLIISPLEELIKNREGDKILQHTWTRMHRNAVRLLTMINQLLDVRKAEAGLIRLEAGEGNIVQFVGEIVISFRELARQKQIQLIFTPEKALIKLWFDPDQLEKVFYNILSNAFKYTPENGVINVIIEEKEREGMLAVKVTDTGKGISPDKLPFIFDRFFQAEEHHEQSAQGGTGIGLSLAKSVVEQHHGTIEALSTPGKGSTFTVMLPFGDAHFSADEKKRHFTNGENLSDYYFPAELPPNSHPATQPLPASPSGEQRPLLLIVEDNSDIRSYLRESFSNHYQIVEADNGNDGLDFAMRDTPDIMLCDISMPGMDGIELCRQIKTNIITSHIPVILLTARTSLIFKIDGLETGADDYITKPFNLELLRLRIKNLIESRRKLREKYSQSVFHQSHLPEIALAPLDETFLRRTYEILDEHLADCEFSIDELAQKLLMSRMQLYRKLKALTDQTPNELIRRQRLKKAAELLRTGQFTVAEITYKVGFQDLKYFRERFKEEYGVNPSEY